jgi:Ca2+/H+ antiporter, TMEM165/GDT1 family
MLAVHPRRGHGVHFVITAATVFVVIFFAELPDKTALASLVLGTRYRPSLVLIGMMGAFFIHVVIAIAAGSLLHLLPHRVLQLVIAILFLLGAILLLRRDDDEDEAAIERANLSPLRVVGTSFAVIFVAEFGDLTQIVTANLAAKYHAPVAVAVGAVLALWAVGALAIYGGQQLIERVPLGIVTKIAAAIMLVLSLLSIVEAIRG